MVIGIGISINDCLIIIIIIIIIITATTPTTTPTTIAPTNHLLLQNPSGIRLTHLVPVLSPVDIAQQRC